MSFITSITGQRRPEVPPLTRTVGEAVLPSVLDRAADFALQAGHHDQAERLSRLAQEIREKAR